MKGILVAANFELYDRGRIYWLAICGTLLVYPIMPRASPVLTFILPVRNAGALGLLPHNQVIDRLIQVIDGLIQVWRQVYSELVA